MLIIYNKCFIIVSTKNLIKIKINVNFEVKNLNLKFQKKVIFSKINFELNCGDLLVIKGRNGIGKTSLLKILAGILSNQNNFDEYSEFEIIGSIACENLLINQDFESYYYTRSYLPADFDFYEEFEVEFYLKFWQRVNFSRKQKIEMDLQTIICYFNFDEIIKQKKTIAQISSGWKKRLQYARLFLENRPIWILDEPFNFLDSEGRERVFNMINAKLVSHGIVILSDNQYQNQQDYLFNLDSNNIKFLNLEDFVN